MPAHKGARSLVGSYRQSITWKVGKRTGKCWGWFVLPSSASTLILALGFSLCPGICPSLGGILCLSIRTPTSWKFQVILSNHFRGLPVLCLPTSTVPSMICDTSLPFSYWPPPSNPFTFFTTDTFLLPSHHSMWSLDRSCSLSRQLPLGFSSFPIHPEPTSIIPSIRTFLWLEMPLLSSFLMCTCWKYSLKVFLPLFIFVYLVYQAFLWPFTFLHLYTLKVTF